MRVPPVAKSFEWHDAVHGTPAGSLVILPHALLLADQLVDLIEYHIIEGLMLVPQVAVQMHDVVLLVCQSVTCSAACRSAGGSD
jgi:hypothetical protein